MKFKRSLFLTFTLGLLALLPLVADAHDWRNEYRRDWHRRPTVTVYEHADFRGASLTLEIGEFVGNLDDIRFANGSRINDRISSIRIDGPVELVVFEHAGFQGRAMVVGRDLYNLAYLPGRWNDAISSLQVRPARGR
jgi:hypothetical protein